MDVAAEQPLGGIISDPTPAPADDIVPGTADMPDDGVAPIAEELAETPEVDDHIPASDPAETPQGTAPDAAIAGADLETFYIFTWGRAPRSHNNGPRRATGDRPQGKGKPGGRGKKGAARADKGGKPQSQSARPSRTEKPIDPDNPFAAALMGLKDNK